METYKTVVLSTAHMTHEDNDRFKVMVDKHNITRQVYDTGFGYIVKIPIELESLTIMYRGFSTELISVLSWASGQGYQAVHFDCDVGTTPGLKMFEW